MSNSIKISVKNLSAFYDKLKVIDDITLDIPSKKVTAIIGPSGCGKSTFIRCLNRMHELKEKNSLTGKVFLDDLDIYKKKVNPSYIRRRVGMVFQKPNPFPHMSIKENVLCGFLFSKTKPKEDKNKIVEKALLAAALFDEVKDRLNSSAEELSGGQQQRLCIARALAMEPEVLLLDEPCSALDPISTARIEDLISSLRDKYTIVIVTHNMQQAARVSQITAFFLMGKLIEINDTNKLFTKPQESRTEDYITGKFG